MLPRQTNQTHKPANAVRKGDGTYPHANKCPVFGKKIAIRVKRRIISTLYADQNMMELACKKVNKGNHYDHDDAHDSSYDDGYVFGLRENTLNKSPPAVELELIVHP